MNNERIILEIANIPEWSNWCNYYRENQGGVFLNTYDWIVNQDGEVNEDQGEGNTPLFFACRDGFNEVIKFLLNNEAEIDRRNDDGMTPIFFVGNEIDTPDTIQLLIDNGADIHVVDNAGDNLLHQAVQMGSPQCIKFFLNYGVDPFLKNNDGLSAIDLAKKSNYEEIQNIFMEAEKTGLFNVVVEELPELDKKRI